MVETTASGLVRSFTPLPMRHFAVKFAENLMSARFLPLTCWDLPLPSCQRLRVKSQAGPLAQPLRELLKNNVAVVSGVVAVVEVVPLTDDK